MNPFDLPGPQFLLFYAACIAVVLILLYRNRMMRRVGNAAAIEEIAGRFATDPYLIACLHNDREHLTQGASQSVVTFATIMFRSRGDSDLFSFIIPGPH
ncbi:MAG: hypothetical protein FWD68_20670 [Alphaproteobacteria bacterium]|nr:hypothetical protein [Alphaproteobacteria bacterium]